MIDKLIPKTPEAEEAHKKFLKRCEVALKREAIRDGIAIRLHTIGRDLARIIYARSSLNCDWRERYRLDALGLMQYENSQGVVIKVDRELPDTYTSELGEYGAVKLGDGTYLEVVAVEPLIDPASKASQQ